MTAVNIFNGWTQVNIDAGTKWPEFVRHCLSGLPPESRDAAISRDVAFSKITWHNRESTFPFQSKYQKKTRDDAEIVVAIG